MQYFYALKSLTPINVNYALQMGRMSDYDIQPKVCIGSPNECRMFRRMLYARTKQRLLLVSSLCGQRMSYQVNTWTCTHHLRWETM